MNTKLFVVSIFILLFNTWTITKVESKDPCLTDVRLPGWIGLRNEKCAIPIADMQQCDNWLDSGWYRIFNGTMLNKCPVLGNCGSTFPAWMNGSYPSVDDGEVNRDVCIVGERECCKDNVTIKVKNCKDFFVYYLDPLPECTSTYCVESELPCEDPTTTTTTTTTISVPSTSASQSKPGYEEEGYQQSDKEVRVPLKTPEILACVFGTAAFCLCVVVVVLLVHRCSKRRFAVDAGINPLQLPPPYQEVDRRQVKQDIKFQR